MDFDIGNLLYIVITLVIVIIGLMRRKKKTPTRSAKPEGAGGESRPGFLENLERVLTMDEEKPVFVDLKEDEPDLPEEDNETEPMTASLEPETEELLSTPDLMSEYEQVRKDLVGSERDQFLSEGESTTEPLEVIDLEDEERGTDYFEIVKDFDAGTAVVYSAIINRIDY